MRDEKGNIIVSRVAVEIRDELVKLIATLPPMPGALEQILHHFGHENVAEITGRSIRILKEQSTGRIYAYPRSASAGISEAQEFMDDEKRILIFSQAGGTGRSYHSDLKAINQRRRIHYLLEPGWRADEAIQGLGRSHRTNQASAPLYRLVITDVKGELRFITIIERRLDSLGALTRGQRQTGGQGLFDSKANLESRYGEAALDTFFTRLARNQVSVCTLAEFQDATGLKLTTEQGDLKLELPKIRTFLNRVLALPIKFQNELFVVFEEIFENNIEAAIKAGTFDIGVETLRAEGFRALSRKVVYTHSSGTETTCVEIEEKKKVQILQASRAEEIRFNNGGFFYINDRSGRAAISTFTTSTIDDQGASVSRVNLIRPTEQVRIPTEELENSTWRRTYRAEWFNAWQKEVESLPEFSTSRFFLITGLLLPIWNSLDQNSMKVYRLKTDDNEVLLGRVIQPEAMESIASSIGLSQVKLSPNEIYKMVMEDKKRYQIAGGISLKRSSVMQDWRVELVGEMSEGLIEQLLANGCFAEHVNWQRRIFLPASKEKSIPVLERVSELLRGY